MEIFNMADAVRNLGMGDGRSPPTDKALRFRAAIEAQQKQQGVAGGGQMPPGAPPMAAAPGASPLQAALAQRQMQQQGQPMPGGQQMGGVLGMHMLPPR